MSDFRASGLPRTERRDAAYQPVGLQTLVEVAPPPGPSEADILAEQLRQTQAELRQLFAGVQQAANDLHTVRSTLLSAVPEQLAHVTMGLVEQVVQQAVTVSPDIVLRCAQQVMAEVMPEASLVLLLHPADLALLQQHVPDALTALTAELGMQLRDDATMARGMVRVDAAQYRIHGGIPIRLGQLWREVMPGLPLGGDGA